MLSSENDRHTNMFPNTVWIFTLNEEKHATLMQGQSIRLFWNGFGEAHAYPEWPEWFKKYHTCWFYPSRTANGIALSNQRRKVKICQSMYRFSRYTRSTYGVRKTVSATRFHGFVQRDSVFNWEKNKAYLQSKTSAVTNKLSIWARQFHAPVLMNPLGNLLLGIDMRVYLGRATD